MFFVEQFFQLTLKYLIGKRYGDFPKIHSLKSLFELSKDDKLINFYKQNLDTFREIELSYIASRYLDIEYSDTIAEKSLKLAKEFLEMVSIGSDELYRTYYKMLDKNEEFFSKAVEIAKEIKEKAIKIFDDCEVFIVGSYARGEHTLSSDLDILIVSDKVPEKFDFEWYSSLVKVLTDDNRINIHLVNRKGFKELERAYTPRISV